MVLVAIAVAIQLVSSLRSRPEPERDAKEAPIAAVVAAPAISTPAFSERECVEFAKRFTESAEGLDLAAVDQLFDFDAMFNRLTAEWEFHYSDRDQAIARLRREIAAGHATSAAFVAVCSLGGTIRLVHCDALHGQVTMRLLAPGGEFSYLVLYLVRADDQSLKIDKFEAPGVTPSWASAATSMIGRFTPYDGPNGRISPDAPNAAQHVLEKTQLYGMGMNLQKGNYSAVIELYDKLSEPLQHDAYVLQLAMRAGIERCYQTEVKAERKYLAASTDLLLARYYQQFPNSESLCFFEYLLASAVGDEPAARSAMAGIRAIGHDDPFLRAFDSFADLQHGRLDAARAAAEESVLAVDYHPLPHLAVFAAANAQHDDERSRKMAAILKERFSEHLEALAQDPSHCRMICSPEQLTPLLATLGFEPPKRSEE